MAKVRDDNKKGKIKKKAGQSAARSALKKSKVDARSKKAFKITSKITRSNAKVLQEVESGLLTVEEARSRWDESEGKKKASKGRKKPVKHANGRNGRGQFLKGVSGNPNGASKGWISYRAEFDAILRDVEKKTGKKILRLFIERAYEDPKVMMAVVDKMLPSLKSVEMTDAISDMDDREAKNIRKRMKERFG